MPFGLSGAGSGQQVEGAVEPSGGAACAVATAPARQVDCEASDSELTIDEAVPMEEAEQRRGSLRLGRKRSAGWAGTGQPGSPALRCKQQRKEGAVERAAASGAVAPSPAGTSAGAAGLPLPAGFVPVESFEQLLLSGQAARPGCGTGGAKLRPGLPPSSAVAADDAMEDGAALSPVDVLQSLGITASSGNSGAPTAEMRFPGGDGLVARNETVQQMLPRDVRAGVTASVAAGGARLVAAAAAAPAASTRGGRQQARQPVRPHLPTKSFKAVPTSELGHAGIALCA